MDFRPMRVNADLNRFHTNVPDPRRLALANHDRVGLELHAELPLNPRVFENLEEILAEKNLAPTQAKNEDACICHLIQQMLDLRSCHLAMILMVEITMHTPLIAPIGQIELHAERDVPRQCLPGHLLEQSAHFDFPRAIGCSDICRIPWLARSRASVSASCSASAASTWYSVQIFCCTICSSGVVPSAACQRMVAVRFRVNRVESRPDMIIISPSRLRAATRELRATKRLIESTPTPLHREKTSTGTPARGLQT